MRSVLHCAALCLLLLPTFAAAEEPAELAATTSLLQAIEMVAQFAPALSIGTPAPMTKQASVCPAWVECPTYNCIVTCNGSYCISDMVYVMCDGHTTQCPGGTACTPLEGCRNPCGYCPCKQQVGSGCLRYCYEF